MSRLTVPTFVLAVLACSLGCITTSFAQLQIGDLSAEQQAQIMQLSPADRARALQLMQNPGATAIPDAISAPAPIEPRPVTGQGQIEADTREALDAPGLGEAPQPRAVNQRLEQFGYDIFAGSPDTFAPADDIPVPSDYVVGPGDTIIVQYFGGSDILPQEPLRLPVTREGSINLIGIGPVPVAGLSFDDVRALIEQRVADGLIGVEVSVTTGTLRSIRIFVLGDAYRPGSYTVSGLSTMTNALLVSGGIRPIGSLRNIELRRSNELIQTMDLYDLLLNGNTGDDVRILPGDVIFIPPIGPTVGIAGEVRRPAIYELKGGETAADVIELAGGLLSTAYPQASQLERINADRLRTLVDLDLTAPAELTTPLQDADVLRVYSVLERMEDIVLVSGQITRPGAQQWRPNLRLTDVIRSVDDLLPRADLDYLLIRREVSPGGDIEVFSANLAAALANPASAANVPLEPRDRIFVFGVQTNRAEAVAPLLEELRLQSNLDMAVLVTGIGGRVRAPGDYPLESGMRISDLIRAGGGLSESAYINEAELARYEIVDGEYRETELLTVDLEAVLGGDRAADLALQPYDHLTVREVSRWRDRQSVTIAGEVAFPGDYPILPGETLASVMRRAGGLTDLAAPKGSIFLRDDLRQREREQLDILANRMESDLATMQLSDPELADTYAVGQTLVSRLRQTEPAGRMVINLENILGGVAGADIILHPGDRLLVPAATQSVTVIGEVQYSASHLFDEALQRDDYILRSGGMTARADDDRIYVVRVDGSVSVEEGARWFNRRAQIAIEPGDTIVVPLETDRVRPLALWTGVTETIYNMAIAVAAINSF